MTAFEFVGIVGAVLSVATFCMRTMDSLRVVAIASNIVWLTYGSLGGLLPVILLELVLLPMNALRLTEIRRLIAQAQSHFRGEVSIEALLPFMSRKQMKPGEILFRKGDISHEMYYVVSGVIWLEEIGESVSSGEMLGEISMFAPERERMATAITETDVELMQMSDDTVFQLYTQDPKFGSYLIRLITSRLIENYNKLKEKVGGTMKSEATSEATTSPAVSQENLPERQFQALALTPEEPPPRHSSRSRLMVLALLLLLLVLPVAGWHLAPYLRSVFFRDAVVTTWINAAVSPIRGQIVGPLPVPGERVGADGRIVEIRDAHADDGTVARSEAEVERLAQELLVLNEYVAELQNTDAELARRADEHAKIFEENLKIKISGMLKELATIEAQLDLVRAEADRMTKLVASAVVSASAADKALIAVRVTERRESELEKEIADAKHRKRAIAQGVFITKDGTGPDWAYDNRDALQLKIAHTKKVIATLEARMAEARIIARAERDIFQRNASSRIPLPPGSIVWSAHVDVGATVVPGQSVVEWIDCGTLFIDVPVSDIQIAEIEKGTTAEVILEGENQVRHGTVMQMRGAVSILGLTDLAALSKYRTGSEGQVLLAIDLGDIPDCPVGQGASVEFPDVDVFDIVRSRLRL